MDILIGIIILLILLAVAGLLIFNIVMLVEGKAKRLHRAITNGNLKFARKLIHKGIDINEPFPERLGGLAPLQLASALGHADLAEMLIEMGAQVDSNTTTGETPLAPSPSKRQTKRSHLPVGNGTEPSEKTDISERQTGTVQPPVEHTVDVRPGDTDGGSPPHGSEDTQSPLVGAEELLAAGRFAEAEKAAEDHLENDPGSEASLNIWKKARKRQGKSIDADMALERKKAIFKTYYRYDSDYAADKITRALSGDHRRSGRELFFYDSDQSPRDRVISEYNLKAFEFDLILNEGKRAVWPVKDEPTTDTGSRVAYRDALNCQYCHKANMAPFWPQDGDVKPFYCQDRERTRGKPGAFRLPIQCPHCDETWFVVWDDDPDPAARLFLDHIERMCKAYAEFHHAHGIWRAMISDDILGKILGRLEKDAKRATDGKTMIDSDFIADDFFNVLTIVPALALPDMQGLLGGPYLGYLQNHCLIRWDKSAYHLANWVFCTDGEKTILNLMFFPRDEDVKKAPTVFPTDLLTSDERLLIEPINQPESTSPPSKVGADTGENKDDEPTSPNSPQDTQENKKLKAELAEAIKGGDVNQAKTLIEKGADVNARYEYDETPIMLVVFSNTEMVKLLIGKGADIDAQSEFGETALYQAVKYGKKEMAQLLVDAGADVNASSEKKWPLAVAAEKGEKAIAEMLIARGADLEVTSPYGDPLLTIVLKNLDINFAKCLLAAGAILTNDIAIEGFAPRAFLSSFIEPNGSLRNFYATYEARVGRLSPTLYEAVVTFLLDQGIDPRSKFNGHSINKAITRHIESSSNIIDQGETAAWLNARLNDIINNYQKPTNPPDDEISDREGGGSRAGGLPENKDIKKYCVVIGADRMSNQQDADELKQAGLFEDATSILDLHINMGDKKIIEQQASTIAYESQYKKLALREWASKNVCPENVSLRKYSTRDGALFVVATY